MENSILNTLEDFELDLKLIENHIEIVQSTFKKKSITIIEKIDLLRDRAIIEFLEKEKLENKMFEERTASLIIDITNKILKKDTIANKIYNSFNVEFNDSNKDSINIISSAPGIIGSLSKREDNTNEYDEVFCYKTVLYNLCSSIEHVFGNVLKDFYINIDQSNRLNNLTINIKDLREINDVKDAEEMLLERKIEDNFYSSFNVWYENIFKEMSLKSIGNEVDFNKVKNFITEMFLIRNLFIHNRGEINDKFKSKTRLNKKLERIDLALNDKNVLEKEFNKANLKLDDNKKIKTMSKYKKIISTQRQHILEEIATIDYILKPSNFLQEKKRLEEALEFYKCKENSEEVLIELQKEFLNFIYKKLCKMNTRDEIVNILYEIRYYKRLKISKEKYITDIEELDDLLDKILKKAITMLCKLGSMRIISMDIDLNFDIIKYALDTKIIDLEEIKIAVKPEEEGLIIRVFDKEVFEKQ